LIKMSVHPTAEVSEKAKVGKGTRIWHQAQVRENAAIGENCNIGKGVYIDFGVEIGNNCKIQNYVSIYHGVKIEDDVFVGPGVAFTNDFYPRAFIWSDEKVVSTLVKKGASIGANSTIICGITVGEYAMIGAGSVVTKDVPDHGLAYGNPAELKGWVCECGRKMEELKKERDCIKGVCKFCNKETFIDKEDFKSIGKYENKEEEI